MLILCASLSLFAVVSAKQFTFRDTGHEQFAARLGFNHGPLKMAQQPKGLHLTSAPEPGWLYATGYYGTTCSGSVGPYAAGSITNTCLVPMTMNASEPMSYMITCNASKSRPHVLLVDALLTLHTATATASMFASASCDPASLITANATALGCFVLPDEVPVEDHTIVLPQTAVNVMCTQGSKVILPASYILFE